MNYGGDAAEQVVRLSLEGIEVAAKITGNGAKNLAIILAAVLKEEQKTKGKARLTNMLKSGKELKVYTIQNKDLKKFTQEAKRYGVLYCVLKDKETNADNAIVDVIARAEDASKIQRITERFQLATVDAATVMGNVFEKETAFPEKAATVRDKLHPAKGENDSVRSEAVAMQNPPLAKTEQGPLSEPNLKQENRSNGPQTLATSMNSRQSVREKLNDYKSKSVKDKEKLSQRGRSGKTLSPPPRLKGKER